jgi:hypothetical protein
MPCNGYTIKVVPGERILTCSCGWQTSMPRRNALAVTAKLAATWRRHVAKKGPQRGGRK